MMFINFCFLSSLK